MVTAYDINPNELIEKVAEKLKAVKEIEAPEWAKFTKTGVSKERVPERDDWWHIRCAAILRTVYRFGPIGVEKLRTKYGSKKRRGARPPHFFKASGNIIRKALQQLEKAGLLEYEKKGLRKGRKTTGKGNAFVDGVAKELAKA